MASSRRLLLCFILFLCVLGRGAHLACVWLLSSVVGGHYSNAKKQTLTFEFLRLIIVLVSLRVLDTLTVMFYFYICFRPFIELQDGIILRKSCPGKKNCDSLC